MNYGNRRKMWKNIPFERRMEIVDTINKMPQSLDKDVLTYLFIKDMSSGELEEYAKKHGILIGKQGKSICSRRIEQIANKYVPDWRDYTPKQQNESRKVHIHEVKQMIKDKCARCGSKKRLEMDHVIPLSVGGTTDEINIQILCHECHTLKTAYERTIFSQIYRPYRKKPKEDDNGQLKLI